MREQSLTAIVGQNSIARVAPRYALADGTLIYSVDYGTRDALGRIVHKTETVQTETHTFDYGYDANGRLVDVFNDGVAPGSTAWDATTTYAPGEKVSSGGLEYASLVNGTAGNDPA